MRSGIAALIMLIVLCAPVLAYDWSTNPGNGTPENPYQISTPEQLLAVGSDSLLLTKNYVLTNDIVFDPNNNPQHVFSSPPLDYVGPKGRVPFSGILDGCNFEIANLRFGKYFSSGGLFYRISPTGILKNIKFINVIMDSSSSGSTIAYDLQGKIMNCSIHGKFTYPDENVIVYRGSFVGKNSGVIEDCRSVCTIKGGRTTGGVAAENTGIIRNTHALVNIDGVRFLGGCAVFSSGLISGCSVEGTIRGSGDMYVGGITALLKGTGIIENCSFKGDIAGKKFAGGIAGEAEATSRIKNCIVKESSHVTGTLYTGGLVGGSRAAIINCQVSCIVDGVDTVGGLCGYSDSYEGTTIKNCMVKGTIRGDRLVGGLCGGMVKTTVLECCASVTVSARENAGGAFGYVGGYNSSISQSFCSGLVSGINYVGGFVGSSSNLTVNSCYSRCNVIGQNAAGGFIGSSYRGTYSHCYGAGSISSNTNAGGFLGQYDLENVQSCYYLDVDGIVPGKGIPLSNAQMKQQSSFTDWDFINTWRIREGRDYPRLWWEFTNAAPVAEANDITAYAWVDGFALVVLDGTRSRDEDGDELTYAWYNDANELIAAGAEPNVVFGVGDYDVTLVVNDGIEDSEPNFCKVTVIAPVETAAKMLPQTISLLGKKPVVKGRLAFTDKPALDAAQPMLLLIGDLEIACASPVLEYVPEDAKWYLTGQFDCAAMNSLAAGNTQVKLVSCCASGQWVFGTDTVKIIKK